MMSYGIIYDKQFVKVGKEFLPMVYSGDNNCYEVGRNGGCGRRSRSWYNQSYMTVGKHFASAEEIIKRAEETAEGMVYSGTKIGSKFPDVNGIVTFYKGAIKRALTVEQLAECGIEVLIFVYVYDWEETTKKTGKVNKYVYAKTTDELLNGVTELEEYYKGTKLNITFSLSCAEERQMKKVRAKYFPKKMGGSFDWNSLEQYFILYKANHGYFVNRTKWKIRYSYYIQGRIRKFKSQKQAENYATKNLDVNWKPMKQTK